MKTCIICNPRAGRFRDPETRQQLAAFPDTQLVFSNAPGEAVVLAHDACMAGFDAIVAAGGDGTLNEVINGAAKWIPQIAFGLIPLGTGNDFARSLDLPTALEDCLTLIRFGSTRQIDLVRVTGSVVRYFVNVSAGGFSGLVDEKLTPEVKRSWGPLAYVRSAAAAFPELKAHRTRVVLDDREVIEQDLFTAVVANGRFVAGGIPIVPEAVIDDGLLDILLVPAHSAGDMMMVAAKIMVGKHLGDESLLFRRAAKVAIGSNPGMWFNVDGEFIGNEPITFDILPRTLQFFAPRPS